MKSLVQSLENSSNESFFRASSRLVVIFLTNDDGEDKSVISAVDLKFGSEKHFEVYGLFIKPGDDSCYKAQRGDKKSVYDRGAGQRGGNHVSYGTNLESLISEVEGLSSSVCSNDYGDLLKQISLKSKNTVVSQTHFRLSHTPVGTVQVNLDPNQSIPWVLEGDIIIFEHPPQPNTKITVLFDITSSK